VRYSPRMKGKEKFFSEKWEVHSICGDPALS
jgi:hypothetical protein